MTASGYVVIACQGLLCLVFAVSVVSKLRGREAFAEFVAATRRLVPRSIGSRGAGRLAFAVVCSEGAAVVLLMIPATTALGFMLATALLGAFTTAIVLALRRGERSPCRCFGASARPLGRAQVIRNAVLLMAAVLGAAGFIAGPEGVREPAGVAISLLAAGLIAVPVLLADDISGLFQPVPTQSSVRRRTSQPGQRRERV